MFCPNAAGSCEGYFTNDKCFVGGAVRNRRPRAATARRRKRVPAVRRRTDALRSAVRELIREIKPRPHRRRREKPAVRNGRYQHLQTSAPTERVRRFERDSHRPPPVDRVVMIDRESVWKGAQVPQPQPMPMWVPPWMGNWQQTVHLGPHVEQNVPVLPPTEVAREPEEAQIFKDARDVEERNYLPRRPADGEADRDVAVRHRWTFDKVVRFLERIPSRGRKLILTGLFGTGVGVVLDLLLGSPLNLTGRLIRLIISLIPGGSLIINTIDGLGYLLGKFQDNPLQITYDPGFQNLANAVQQNLPQGSAQALIQAAEQQLGEGFMRSVAAALSFLVANAPTAVPAALPLAMVRPFRG
ncbi:p32K [Lizard adenovirus 2]|uniref:p32K n=1 Tax=Lizard adenovirus 2 TaxID=874272 RepID=A0A076FTA2_9ADEN|nr:p32K [Lizard adenovirus 2]AII22558.1 p32K [Lizard adenovirus 2]